MKPEVNLIEVKDGVYVITVKAKTPAVAVYWIHEDGASSLMRPGKRKVDIKSKISDGKHLSLVNSAKLRASFSVIDGGKNAKGLSQATPARCPAGGS